MMKILSTIIFIFYFALIFGQEHSSTSMLNAFNIKEDVLFKTVNGKNLKMDIYYPNEEKVQAANPWILFVHGGGWAGGDRDNILKAAFLGTLQNLVDNGVAVASIDYRLAKSPLTSYESMVDCKDAAKFLLKNADQYKLDTLEYGVWGGSAGGHLGLLTALAPDSSFMGDATFAAYSTNFKCVLAFYPFTSCLEPSIRPNSIFADGSLFTRLLGGTLQEKPELAKLLSPSEHLSESTPPTLLVHGTKDPTLPIINSEFMVQVANEKNANVRLLAVQNAKHSFGGSNLSPSLAGIADSCTQFVLSHLNVKSQSTSVYKKVENKFNYLKINNKDQLVFDFDDGFYSLHFFDTNGRLLEQRISENEAVVQKSTLPKGLIIIKVIGNSINQLSATYKINNF